MGASQRYREIEAPTGETEKELKNYPPLLRKLLSNRGICSQEEAEVFLNPNYETGLHDPFLLTDMERAAKRILLALEKQEHIVIYTDYDCDGIPGGVVLHDFFTAIGYTNFENYIPHRHHDGYGFNARAVEAFASKQVDLIITVDCGIVDHEAVDCARETGIDVIVTDHHEPSDTLPSAYAVINPKRDNSYPFKGICGTGVAFKLALAVLTLGRANGSINLPVGQEKWLLDLVGIATVADMVPLTDENRVLAHYGLAVLRKSRRAGLQQLLRKAKTSQQFLTEDDIGFTIAPRINAASRMDNPEDAFHMLRTRDEREAGSYVLHLEKLNNERKGVVASMVKEAKRRLSMQEEVPGVIVLGNPEWRPSLVGLVASALVEEYERPAFVWGRDGRGLIKGSCRGIGHVSVVAIMEKAKEAFLGYGGHHGAGGFSVSDDTIYTLSEILNSSTKGMLTHSKEKDIVIQYDADIQLTDIHDELLRYLKRMSPFGVGNPKPLFRFINVTPQSVTVFGKTKNHTKLTFGNGSEFPDAIAFFKTPEQFDVVPRVGEQITLIAHVEESYYLGKREVRLRIVDLI